MSFNTSLASTQPGFGSSISSSVNALTAVALSTTGAVANTVPSSGNLVPTFGVIAGKVRVKIYNGGGTSPTLVAIVIKLSDGTNTVTVDAFNPAVAVTLSATSWFDGLFAFLIDTGATANGGALGQLISNTTQNGALTLSVTTTLGGTTPTALMDVEVRAVV
jgi:hypothetical protein